MEKNEIREILTERGKIYGQFKDHARISQKLKKILESEIVVRGLHLEHFHIEAISMICHKLARIVNGDPNYDDSWKDIAGYAQLVVDILNKAEKDRLNES